MAGCTSEKLYIVYDDGKSLYKMEIENKNPRHTASQILYPGTPGINPDASSNGHFLSFISNSASERVIGIWRVHGKVEWHAHPEFNSYIFNPSPIDDTKYAFSALNSTYLDIYSSNQTKNITNFRSMDFEPSISPNGKALAFTSSRISNADIYTNERPPSDRQAIEAIREWDITERGITYNTYRDHNIDIFTSNIDGTNTVRITSARALDHQPDWSHDGDWIVFSSLRHNNSEIFKIKNDGTKLQRLTNNQTNDEDPAWSPDGNLIAFISDRSGSKNVYVMKPDGTNQIAITHALSNLYSPTWIKCKPGIFKKVGKTCP